MNTKPIRADKDLTNALLRIEQLWGAASNSAEGDELEVLAMLVEKYEEEHFPIPASNPAESIKFQKQRESREHEAFLQRKVDIARASISSGENLTHEEVEAEFSAKRLRVAEE